MESQPLERQLSIESEPKTLFHRDLRLAREVALEVIKKHTKEEALRIFLEENAMKLEVELSEDIEEEEEEEKGIVIRLM